MDSTRYRAVGLVCVTADNLDDLQRQCKAIMRFCDKLGNMDVYDQDGKPCGKISREIIYMPEVTADALNISL